MNKQTFCESMHKGYDAAKDGIKSLSPQDQEKMAKLKLINDKIIKRNISDQEQRLLAQVVNKTIRNIYIIGAVVLLFQACFFLFVFPNLGPSYNGPQAYNGPQNSVLFFFGLLSGPLLLGLFARFLNKKKAESDVVVFDALVFPMHGITEKCLGVTLDSGNEKIFVRKNNIADKEFFKTLKYWSLKTNPYRITMMEKSRIILSMEPL